MVFVHLNSGLQLVLNVGVCILLAAGVRSHPLFTNISEECRPYTRSRVSHGVNTGPGEFPFMVSLQVPHKYDASYFEHYCGGTLISPKVILTAAHCIWDQDKGLNFREVTGDKKTGDVDENYKAAINPFCRHQQGEGLFIIKKFYIHPDYDGSTDGGADIALLELERDYNGVTQFPVYEDSGSFDFLTELIIMGWGYTNAKEANNEIMFLTSVKPLQKATVTMRNWPPPMCTNSKTFCAAGSTSTGGTVDTCRGDSGGPVLQVIDNNYVVVGITSYGDGEDCQAGSMGVYTRVSYYKAWIDAIKHQIDAVDLINISPVITDNEQGGCASYSTNGPNQLAYNEGTGIFAPSGGSFMTAFNAQNCAAACEALNAKCGYICCDSFTYHSGKTECWFKSGGGRGTSYSSQGWQSYWRESNGGSGQYQICEEDWKATGFAHAYMTKGPRQLAINEGLSLSTSSGQRSLKVSGVEHCANECEAVSACNSFSYNPGTRDCYLKQGQNYATRDDNRGWQSYWQLTESTAQSQCGQIYQYCIYCGGTINNCRGY
eukprot:TRINITY_DN10254_c0_g1_i10.p1 TRINITY_DN10254_c0_g1~~TRINITY_DN10254_c0_g1_i10.p1  ORF type:complete len:592 (-),score=25.25 TRINITY_DN10254_c0_g1_i10:1409-3043(-)